MPELKLYKSPRRAIRLILLTIPFVGLSLYDIIIHSDIMPIAFDWFCLCFFGLGIPLGIFNLFDRRPIITINEIGIYDRISYNDFVNWNLIKDAYLRDVHNQKFICLVLDDKAIPLLKINKKLKGLSKALGFQEVNISLGQLRKIDEQKFVEFIKAMSDANMSTRINLLSTSYL